MIYLAVGVVGAVVLTLLNLLLTFGVIRRLRDLQARVDTRIDAPPPGPDAGPPAGSPVPRLTATTVAGTEVSTVDPGRPTLIGFFAPGCLPCAELIPEFVRYKAADVAKVAVVVTDLPPEGDDYVRRLSAVDVTVQSGQEGWPRAFSVHAYPTVCLVSRDGLVLGSGNSFRELPTLSAV